MKFEELKKEYLKTQTNDYLSKNGWSDLQSKLDSQKSDNLIPLYTKGLAIAGFVLLISGALLTTSAKPGSPLYSLKILSDNTQAKISGNYDMTIEKRAQDVIDSQESQKNLEKATQEYLNTLDQVQQKPKTEDKKKELENILKEQEQKFQEARQKDLWDESKFQEIIRKTRRARGEVEGARDDTNDNQDK